MVTRLIFWLVWMLAGILTKYLRTSCRIFMSMSKSDLQWNTYSHCWDPFWEFIPIKQAALIQHEASCNAMQKPILFEPYTQFNIGSKRKAGRDGLFRGDPLCLLEEGLRSVGQRDIVGHVVANTQRRILEKTHAKSADSSGRTVFLDFKLKEFDFRTCLCLRFHCNIV